jgi:hypothetical protein
MSDEESTIIGVVKLRDIKNKPGAVSMYIGAELFEKIDLPLDTDLVMKFNNETKELCIKKLQY